MATLGPALIGATISSMLYGVTIAQVVNYYVTYDDGLAMKCFIGFIWIMDTLHQCLVGHVLWWYLVARCNGNNVVCADVVWSLYASAIPTELSAFVVECFFIIRIWRFREKKSTFMLLVPAALGPILSMVYLIYCIQGRGFFMFETNQSLAESLTCLSASFYIFTDIATTTTMCYVLHKSQEGGLRVSKWLIGVVLRYTVTTGLLSCIVQAIYLITVVASWATGHGKDIYIGIYFITAKTYINCMLASLNSRASLREQLGREYIRSVNTI